MRTIQIYATASGTASAVAQVVIPVKARIKSIIASLFLDSVTDASIIRVELSKSPVSQIATNGAVDAFFQLGMAGNFVTSGLAQYGVNKQYSLDVDCLAGQIIYLHTFVGGTSVIYFDGILWYA